MSLELPFDEGSQEGLPRLESPFRTVPRSAAMRTHLVRFGTHQELAGLSANTIDRRSASLGLLFNFARARAIDDIDRDDVEAWLITYRNPATRRAYLADARAFWKWATGRQYATKNPTDGIPTPKVPKTIPNPLSPEEITRLQRVTAHHNDDVAVGLGLFAGLRVSEIANLHTDDINLSARILIVRQGKGGKDRSIPIATPLLAVLTGCDGKVHRCKSGPGVSQRIKLLFRHAHITGHRPHDLRATFATELIRRTGNIKLVSELLGHATIATTERYVLLDPPGVKDLDQMYQPPLAA